MSAAPKKPPCCTSQQRQELIGAPIHVKGHGNGKIVGWTGHDQPWPTVRLDRDPPYFGALLCDDPDSMRAAMFGAGMKLPNTPEKRT